MGQRAGAARGEDRVGAPAIGDDDLAAHVDLVIIARAVAGEEGRAALGRHEDDFAAHLPAIGRDGEGARLGADRAETIDDQRAGHGEREEGVERFLAHILDPGLAAFVGDVAKGRRLVVRACVAD